MAVSSSSQRVHSTEAARIMTPSQVVIGTGRAGAPFQTAQMRLTPITATATRLPIVTMSIHSAWPTVLRPLDHEFGTYVPIMRSLGHVGLTRASTGCHTGVSSGGCRADQPAMFAS